MLKRATLGVALAVALIGCSGRIDSGWRPLETGRSELLTWAQFPDETTGFLVGGDRESSTDSILLVTRDGGGTFRRVDLSLERRLYGIHFPSRRTGFLVGFAGTCLRTQDGGENFERLAPPTDAWLAGVWFLTEERGFVVGGGEQGAVLLVTEDGGETWDSLHDDLPSRIRGESLRGIYFPSPETGYIVGTGGTALRTVDGGTSWKDLSTGSTEWLRSVFFLDDRHGFIGGAQGEVLVTEDGGETFRPTPLPDPEKVNAVAVVSDQRIYAATMEGRLFESGDGGRSWSVVLDADGVALTSICITPAGTAFLIGDDARVWKLEPSGRD